MAHPLGYRYRVSPERTEYLGNGLLGPNADIVTRLSGLLFEVAV